jgi:hypothetical protein
MNEGDQNLKIMNPAARQINERASKQGISEVRDDMVFLSIADCTIHQTFSIWQEASKIPRFINLTRFAQIPASLSWRHDSNSLENQENSFLTAAAASIRPRSKQYYCFISNCPLQQAVLASFDSGFNSADEYVASNFDAVAGTSDSILSIAASNSARMVPSPLS